MSTLPTDQLIVGNCVDVMGDFPSDSIDLTVTSPPYDKLRNYEGFEFDAEAVGHELLRVTKPGGVVVWVVGDHISGGRSMTSFRQAVMFQDMGFTVHDVMIYQKLNTPFPRSNAYTNAWEFMFVLSKGRPKTFNPMKTDTVRNGMEKLTFNKGPDAVNHKRWAELKTEKTRNNIWAYAVGLGGTTSDRDAFEHPAMFPEKLARDHVVSWSNPGEVVLDPMCGAGTTAKMSAQLGRRYIGIDICERYIEIARNRLNAGFEPALDASVAGVGKRQLARA